MAAEKENRRTLVQTEAKYESKINKIMAKITSLETEKTDLESQILALERSEQKLKESSEPSQRQIFRFFSLIRTALQVSM